MHLYAEHYQLQSLCSISQGPFISSSKKNVASGFNGKSMSLSYLYTDSQWHLSVDGNFLSRHNSLLLHRRQSGCSEQGIVLANQVRRKLKTLDARDMYFTLLYISNCLYLKRLKMWFRGQIMVLLNIIEPNIFYFLFCRFCARAKNPPSYHFLTI